MKVHRVFLIALASLLAMVAVKAQTPGPMQMAGPAETIYYHGNILTGVGLAASGVAGAHAERVTAMAVGKGLVLATGSDAAIEAKYKGPATQLVDLHGAFAMPGFNDAHVHLGMVRETAQALIEKKIPPPTAEERRKSDVLALHDAVAHGVTSVQDNSDWEDFLVYEQLERAGALPVRVSEWLPFSAPLEVLEQRREYHPATDRMLHTTMLTGSMDGALGSRTAALNALAVERAKAGFQMGFDATGDRAVSMALDTFAAAEQAVKQQPVALPPRMPQGNRRFRPPIRLAPRVRAMDFRYRIEGSQGVDAADLARYRQLGVIASVQPDHLSAQPDHLLTDVNRAEQRLGQERAGESYAWKSFLDAGVVLCFGTDYPAEPITPFRGLYAAMTRKNEAGTVTYSPAQKLTIWQALYAYTQAGAYAEFTEYWKGKLAAGYVADFVVLDRDLTAVAPAEILKTKVLRTVVGGKTVYAQ